ncbi:hypothetical protein [Corallococcus sp. M7]
MYVVFPYNYDDNSENSRAMGTDLRTDPAMVVRGAQRLTATLVRWATASRSGIVAVPKDGVDVDDVHAYGDDREKSWDFRPYVRGGDNRLAWKRQVWGVNPGKRRTHTFLKGHEQAPRRGHKLYSIKTGVQYVGLKDQTSTSKDLLEENSAHAMLRSDLISEMTSKYKHYSLETRYQLEVLCVQMYLGKQDLSGNGVDADRWDGFQVRELGSMDGEIWFPALSIPTSGKTFAKRWAHKTDFSWKDFWGKNFAEKLGRAKAEMLVLFGLQHMTANSQNMLIAFPRDKGGYNASTDAKAIILRDIGDTLLNDHFYKVLQKVQEPYKHLWSHEVASPFGVTLSSSIGQYFQPLITRLGTTIVFFFEPFMQGDLAKNNNDAQTCLVTWGLMHNTGFVQYLCDKLGYDEDWQEEPTGPVPSEQELQAIMQDLINYSGYDKRNTVKYTSLVKTVLGLHSKVRWMLIESIEDVHIDGNGQRNYVVNDYGKKVVDAHDLLIGAEIQQYIKSATGQKALLDFHKKAHLGMVR